MANLPGAFGRGADQILDTAMLGGIAGLVVAGVDPYDTADPQAFLDALERVPCVVSLEFRHTAVTERAHVVFPVAPVAEKSGTFVDWEGRPRPFETALDADAVQAAGLGEMPDLRVLDRIADAMDVHLGLPTVGAARAELAQLGLWHREKTPALQRVPARPAQAGGRRGRPGHLAPAAGRRVAPGVRAVPGRHPQAHRWST